MKGCVRPLMYSRVMPDETFVNSMTISHILASLTAWTIVQFSTTNAEYAQEASAWIAALQHEIIRRCPEDALTEISRASL